MRYLRVYEYIVYIYIPKETRLKLKDIAIKTYLISYILTLR
jgi:hypothetical protein